MRNNFECTLKQLLVLYRNFGDVIYYARNKKSETWFSFLSPFFRFDKIFAIFFLFFFLRTF